MNQKGFTPILIVLLIGIVIGGYFVYQNQNKPTPPPQQSFNNTQGKPTQSTPVPSPIPVEEIVYTEASQSANWKTYTSLSFVFKYPEGWEISPQKVFNEDPESQLYLENKDQFVGALVIHKKGYKFRMNAEDPKIPSLQEWLAWNRFIRSDLPNQTCNQISYGILSGYECTLNPYGNTSFNFIAKTSDQFIEFSNGTKDHIEEFKQILSTFRFD